MKKFLSILLFSGVFCLGSCDYSSSVSSSVDVVVSDSTVVLTQGFYSVEYDKVVVEGHDYYFRLWTTKSGKGSDLVHRPNCRRCALHGR